jgi:hypothetical protein
MAMFYIGAFAVIPISVEAEYFNQQQTGGTPVGANVENVPKVVTPPSTINNKTGCVSSKDEYCLLEPLVIDGVAQKSVNIQDYVKTMFKIGVGLAALFAVFMIIIGGFQYMMSESIGGKGDGKEKIEGALWGLGLALGSFLILNTINPQLLEFSGGLEPIVVTTDLAKRDAYTDTNLALDRIRQNINECNAQEKDLRALGKNDEADALALKCKIDATSDAIAAKISAVDVKQTFLGFEFRDANDSAKGDEETKNTIYSAGNKKIIQTYDKEIDKIKKEIETDTQDRRTKAEGKRKEADDLEEGANGVYDEKSGSKITELRREAVEIENDSTKKNILTSKIDLLKVKKEVDLIKVDQNIDAEKALRAISLSKLINILKTKKEVDGLKANIIKRGNDEYRELSKTYPKEAEEIRAYSAERTKKIDDAYKERLDQVNNSN